MKYEWRKYIDEMRKDGYAVVVLSPDELSGTNASRVEECLRLGFGTLIKRDDVHLILGDA